MTWRERPGGDWFQGELCNACGEDLTNDPCVLDSNGVTLHGFPAALAGRIDFVALRPVLLAGFSVGAGDSFTIGAGSITLT